MSKWILIYSENNSIEKPDVFNTYKEAYSEMRYRFNELKMYDDEASIGRDYASIQSEYDSFDWRIFEIKF